MESVKFSVALIFVFSIICCKKPMNNPGLSLQNFPLAIGDKWVYQVIDSSGASPSIDTETIIVTFKNTYPNDSVVYFTQTTLNNIAVDSGTIIASNNFLSYRYTNFYYSLFNDLEILFPLALNETWLGNNFKVSGANISINTLGNTYTNVYQINENASGFYGPVFDVVDICPNVGIVYQSLSYTMTYGTKRTSARLINYSLH
jgi:hypothetical protein